MNLGYHLSDAAFFLMRQGPPTGLAWILPVNPRDPPVLASPVLEFTSICHYAQLFGVFVLLNIGSRSQTQGPLLSGQILC